MPTKLLVSTVALLLAIASFGCTEKQDFEEDREELLRHWVSGVLLPLYSDSVALATELEESADNLCAAPSETLLADTQAHWRALRTPWKNAEVFHFGPYREEPIRLGPKIDAWPARPDSVAALLASDEAIDAASLALSGVFVRGMPAIEVLLFDTDEISQFDARRCEYLVAATERLRLDIDALRFEWAPEGGDFGSELSDPSESRNKYGDRIFALSEVVNRMGFSMENLRLDKLSLPAESSDPMALESFVSGRSIEDALEVLRGIEILYFGEQAGDPSLSGYLALRGARFDDEMAAHLAEVRASLTVLTPLRETLLSDRTSVDAAAEEIRLLQVFFQDTVISRAGLIVEFNDTDGD